MGMPGVGAADGTAVGVTVGDGVGTKHGKY